MHLVDIDSEALSSGAERQGVASHPRLRLHGGVDVTAALGVLSDRTPMSELVPADFEAMAAWPTSRTAMVLPGGFDRVASTCVLSQILETAAHSLGKGHRQLADAEAALRAGHLRLMAGLAASGGEAVLVTDVVSSQMLAALPALPAEALAGLLTRLGVRATISAGYIPGRYWRPCAPTRPSGRSSRPWPSSRHGDGGFTIGLTSSRRSTSDWRPRDSAGPWINSQSGTCGQARG